MNQNFFLILFQICTMTTCAFHPSRYSYNMQDQSQLPQELSTAHEVILVQSNAIVAQKSQIDQLTKEREVHRSAQDDPRSSRRPSLQEACVGLCE